MIERRRRYWEAVYLNGKNSKTLDCVGRSLDADGGGSSTRESRGSEHSEAAGKGENLN